MTRATVSAGDLDKFIRCLDQLESSLKSIGSMDAYNVDYKFKVNIDKLELMDADLNRLLSSLDGAKSCAMGDLGAFQAQLSATPSFIEIEEVRKRSDGSEEIIRHRQPNPEFARLQSMVGAAFARLNSINNAIGSVEESIERISDALRTLYAARDDVSRLFSNIIETSSRINSRISVAIPRLNKASKAVKEYSSINLKAKSWLTPSVPIYHSD